MKWRTLAYTVILFASVISCTSVTTPTPTTLPLPSSTATALPLATSAPTLTPMPTNTPTPPLPPIAATAWASDVNGKVNPQMMYPLVGAINYKYRKTVDVDFVLLRLAVVTDQDLSKLDANAQKSLRTNIVARLNQSDELKKWLLNIRTELIRLYPSQPPFKIVIENDNPTQAIAETDGTLVRYSPDARGNLAKLDRYNLLPPLYVDGKDIKRKDTGEVVQLKGVDIPSHLNSSWAKSGDNRYFFGLISIAKEWGANHVKIIFRARRVEPYMAETKQIIEEAERLGMYVILTGGGLVAEGPNAGYNDIPLPNDEMIQSLVTLARELKPYNNLILDIWNEPAGIAVVNPDPNALDDFERQTYEVFVKAIKAIRTVNDQVAITVTGVRWGCDLTYLNLLPPLPDSNLIFRVQHLSWMTQNLTTIPDWRFDQVLGWWKHLIGVRPIIIGEWGLGGGVEGQNADPSRWYERTLNELVNKYGLSYSQHQLGGYTDNYPLDLANRTNISCTKTTCMFTYTRPLRGEVIFNDLQKFPPTQFDK